MNCAVVAVTHAHTPFPPQKWRRALHAYDPPEAAGCGANEDGLEAEGWDDDAVAAGTGCASAGGATPAAPAAVAAGVKTGLLAPTSVPAPSLRAIDSAVLQELLADDLL